MRRIILVLLLPAAGASLALAGGCSGSSSASGADASLDGSGVIVGGGDSSAGDAPTEGGSSATTTMRLAHASNGLGPIDFCWRPTGTATLMGPVLSGARMRTDAGTTAPDSRASTDSPTSADAADAELALVDAQEPGAGAGALAFGSMTGEVTLPISGTLDIAIVPAGQTSCLEPSLVDQVTLDAGATTTVVVMGVPGQEAGPSALTLAGFVDETPSPSQTALVRLIHAALGSSDEPSAPALAIWASATLVAADIEPGKATTESATNPSVNALGYTTVDPTGDTVFLYLTTVGDAHAPATWTTPATALGLGPGSVHTGLIVSLEQGALGVAWCGDADAGQSACTLLTASH